MAGLLLAGDVVFSSLAVGSILVVAVAVLGSLTVLPALLAKLGRWVDRPRVPVLWRLTAARVGRDGQPKPPRLWPALLRPALRHPRVTLVVSVGLLLALAAPALGMQLKFPGMEDLPRTTPVMQAYDRLTAAYPEHRHHARRGRPGARGRGGGAEVARWTTSPGAAAATRCSRRSRRAGRTSGTPPTAGWACCRWPRRTPAGPTRPRSRWRCCATTWCRPTVGGLAGAEYAVGGMVAVSEDYADHVWSKLPIVVAFVLILTFIVMAWTFRSVVVALTSILLNLLSAAASYGLVVLVFQGTWAEGLLGFTSMGAIVSWLPLFLFVVLFGLSMDYHVFVVSRIREAVRSRDVRPGTRWRTASRRRPGWSPARRS